MPLSDNTNALLKSAAQNDMPMVEVLLRADLQSNFIDTNGFMFHMAQLYQSQERGVCGDFSHNQDVVTSNMSCMYVV